MDELEVEILKGRGVAVLVEGDGYEDDAWFYREWFGGRAPQVTFFPFPSRLGRHKAQYSFGESMDKCFDPPADLILYIDRILEHAAGTFT